MRNTDIAVGQRIGRLTVVDIIPATEKKSARISVVCDCGERRILRSYLLDRSSPRVRSCGCLRREVARTRRHMVTHGHTVGGQSRTYASWRSMLNRCLNERVKGYEYYGGRGVTVCERWRGPGGFENFLADMGERPAGRSLDRIDPFGNYEPSNCRWATAAEQATNKRPRTTA